ncbi:MAG TPA: serine hydrolase [Solirubrobacteraceae bacterium]
MPARDPRALLGSAVLIAALAVPAAAPAAGWVPHVREAVAYAQTRKGEVRFAVRTEHGLWGYRRTSPVHSASVVKALLLVAYLDHPAVRGRPLRPADHALIDPMIRRSDNQAANRVLAFVGARRVQATARRVGMSRFRLNPIVWGGSLIDASDQTRFFLHFEAHVVARHRATALRLLASIVPSQRWGIGKARPDGWRLYFKGGWGAGTGLVDHQVALLVHGSDRVAAAVLTTGNPDHAYGQQTLRGVFARLLRGLGPALVLSPL